MEEPKLPQGPQHFLWLLLVTLGSEPQRLGPGDRGMGRGEQSLRSPDVGAEEGKGPALVLCVLCPDPPWVPCKASSEPAQSSLSHGEINI